MKKLSEMQCMESTRSALVAFPGCSAQSLEATIRGIVSEPISCVKQREEKRLHHLLAAQSGRCVVFGAGNMGRRALAALRSIGVRPLAVSDNNPALWETSLEGIPLLQPQHVATLYGHNAHFFITIRNEHHWYRETFDQLTSLGCRHVSSGEPIAWRFPETHPPFLLYDQPHKLYQQADRVVMAAQLWADEASRAEYLAQVKLRALGDPSALPKPSVDESYFLEDIFKAQPGEIFLDCGAFDGDTIRNLIERGSHFDRIDAVEADSRSFARLSEYIATLSPRLRRRIHLHPCAVGSHHGAVLFDDTGDVNSKVSQQGARTVDMIPIDVLYASRSVSMIKMDIEGGEFDALLGATHVIKRDHPILAICVYHSQEDLWRLPLLIRSINPDYRMYLKTYRGDGIQTVAYAVPPERILTDSYAG